MSSLRSPGEHEALAASRPNFRCASSINGEVESPPSCCKDLQTAWRLDADRVALEFLRHQFLSIKAGYRNDQPRWPRGSGENSGRWRGGAGASAPDLSPRTERGGHHFVPRQVFDGYLFDHETRKVFDRAVTGPLPDGPHLWSPEHKQYNSAVREALDRYLADSSVRPSELTPEQARIFVDQIKTSTDPRIRKFNADIYRRQILYYMRRIPLGRGRE